MFINDCEAEEVLFRNPEGAEKNAREVLKSTMKKIEQKLPQDPFCINRIKELYQATHHEPLPDDVSVTRQDVIDLLLQRFFLHKDNFGELSKEIKKPFKTPPIQTVFKCKDLRNARWMNFEKKQYQPQSSEGYLQWNLLI